MSTRSVSVHCLPVLVALVVCSSPGAAQEVTDLAIDPANPTPSDSIVAQAGVSFPCLGFEIAEIVTNSMGDRITVDIFFMAPGPFCQPVFVQSTLEQNIGTLSAGNYAITATMYDFQSGVPTNSMTLDFTVDACSADANADRIVDVQDLIAVISDWGTDGSEHGGDVDRSGIVDVDDLVAVVLAWGPCGQ